MTLAIIYSCQENRKFEIDEQYLQNYEKITGGVPKGPRLFYLQLVGMFELNPLTTNQFGSNKENEHILEMDGVPEIVGSIEFAGDSMIFHSSEDIQTTTAKDSIVTDFHLNLNKSGHSRQLKYHNIKWFATSFGGKKFLRILDTSSAEVNEFRGFERFPPTADYIFEGKVSLYDQPKVVEVPTVFDFTESATFVGTVEIEYRGQQYNLQIEKGGFIMFSDETSGDDTYGAGRYMRIGEPSEDGSVVVDFNYAINPPCSFSDFTTCLFPPKDNRLPFKVMAGEKTQRL